MAKDNRWLQVEVCREYLRQSCSRPEDECRFAHPPQNVDVVNGRVVACFDNIKGRCHRESCRYLHPPRHIKEQLENAGKSHSAALANGVNGHSFPPLQTDQFFSQNSQAWPGNLTAFPGSPVVAPSTGIPIGSQGGGRRADKSDRLEACREFLRGTCNRSENECRFAHPPEHISVDSSDSTVTVCMDFMKDRCSRETCRYFHPPPHLKQRVRQQQQQHQASMNASTPTGVNSGSPSLSDLPSSRDDEKAVTLNLEQLHMHGGAEDVDQSQAPPPPLTAVQPFDAGQVPVGFVPLPIPGAAVDGCLATAVNRSIMAIQRQPSMVKYQEMMANYAAQPDPNMMSEFAYPLSLHPGQQLVPAYHPNHVPVAVPYMGYFPVPYFMPYATTGPSQSMCAELPSIMAQLHL